MNVFTMTIQEITQEIAEIQSMPEGWLKGERLLRLKILTWQRRRLLQKVGG